MNRVERSSRRRSRKPLFIFFMVLASGLLIGTAALTVGDSWLLGPGFIYPNSSLSNNVAVNGTLRVFGQHVCLENGSYCPASSGNGSAGPAGTNGTNGINGTRWTLNTTFPSSPNINDSFLNTSTGVYWQWTGSAWVQKGNLTGPKGAQGDAGPQGNPGATGADGQAGTNGSNGTGVRNATVLANGSLQLGLTNGTIWILGNVTGAKGDQGIQGIQGIQGDAGAAGAAGLNGTGIKNIYLLANGSLQINLTNGTNITTANITGATGPQGATGEAGTNGSNASVTSSDLYINITNGIVGANITHFDLRYYLSSNPDSYTTLAAVVAAIQNTTICHTDGTNCPPAGGGNSSWNESYARSIFITNGSSARLITLNATNVNVSGITATNRLLVGATSTGDQSELVVAGDTNVSGVIYGGSATLGGLTTTSDATVQGVLVVDPGTATAAAVRVGGPLTTYSALQFQSEQNRTRDFIFSSVNNSVASNRMAFRVTGNEAGANAGGDLSILRFDDSGAFIDTIMKIDRSDGYVGIGDTTPDAKLDVLGDTILDGNLNVTGTVYVNGNVNAQSRNISYAPAFRDILYAAGPAGVSITGMNATARCSSFPVEDNTRLVFDNIKFMVDNTNSSVGVYVAIYNCTSANKFDCTSGTLLINESKTALSSTAMRGPTNTTGNWTLPSGNYVSCTSTNVTNAQSGVLRGTTGSAGTGSTLRLTITRGAFPQSASFTASESDGVPYVYLYRSVGVVS